MSIQQPVLISLAKEPALIEEALLFINAVAQARHKAAPPPPPEILFSATQDGAVVGTIALDFCDGSRLLLLEHIYHFDTSPFSPEFPHDTVAQYGRWMCPSLPRISIALAYIATIYSLHFGKTYGWFEAKPFIAKRLSEIGMELEEVSPATLRLEQIHEGGRSYYTEEPVPRIYKMHLERFARALLPAVHAMIQENILILDTSFLNS